MSWTKPITIVCQLGRLFQMLEGLGTQIEKDGLLDKYRKPESNASYMQEWSSLTKKFVTALPYSLTSSQLKAVSEIIWDLKQPVPMNRLLQVWILNECVHVHTMYLPTEFDCFYIQMLLSSMHRRWFPVDCFKF